ncbi:MAG: hypothetical protein Q7R56_01740 [Nanoarchaeota archaeon]|nr:hypothetical protein [Nanoarchaeota archaeon]
MPTKVYPMFYYLTKNKLVKATTDIKKWNKAMSSMGRKVKQENIKKYHISTVFLGLDHGFGGKPTFFETMIFGTGESNPCRRYTTWKQAEKGHKQWAKKLTNGVHPDKLEYE